MSKKRKKKIRSFEFLHLSLKQEIETSFRKLATLAGLVVLRAFVLFSHTADRYEKEQRQLL